MIAVDIPLPLKAMDIYIYIYIYELRRDSSTTSVGSRQLMRKRNTHAFDAVDGSSHRHRERLLAVPSGLIEQHDGVGGRPHGGIEVGGNEALVGEARRTLALRSCVCTGRDPGGRKQNEKGFHNL